MVQEYKTEMSHKNWLNLYIYLDIVQIELTMAEAKSYKMRTITLNIKFVRLMMIMLVFNLETQKLLCLELIRHSFA